MPCGHTPEEFDQFSKVERRIMHMIFDLKFGREEICAAMEIKDGTLRYHTANIKRKQAVMRVARANAEIKKEQQRQADTFMPDMIQEEEIPETRRTVTHKSKGLKHPTGSFTRAAHNKVPLADSLSPASDAPILHPVSIPPKRDASPFVDLSATVVREASPVGVRPVFRASFGR